MQEHTGAPWNSRKIKATTYCDGEMFNEKTSFKTIKLNKLFFTPALNKSKTKGEQNIKKKLKQS